MIKDLLLVALSSAVSVAVLFLLTKMMGHKQVSQLNLFDYIIGISIGSIAAEMASEIENPEKPLVAMAVYGIIATVISIAELKSPQARKFISGSPAVLMRGTVIYRKELKKARLNLNDLLMSARCQGYFNLSEIELAFLEQNGTVSFLPKSVNRPLTPDDMSITPPKADAVYDVVMDGKVMTDNLRKCGRNEGWLSTELKKQGYGSVKNIFLAVLDGNGNLSVYKDE